MKFFVELTIILCVEGWIPVKMDRDRILKWVSLSGCGFSLYQYACWATVSLH